MATNKKAKLFVKYLAGQLISGRFNCRNKKKLIKAFKGAVDELSTSSLKDELEEKTSLYFKKLLENIDKLLEKECLNAKEHVVHEKTAAPQLGSKESTLTALPYNLYSKKASKIRSEVIDSATKQQQKSICCIFLKENILNMSEKMVSELFGINQPDMTPTQWAKKMQELTSIFIDNNRPAVLHKLMMLTSCGLAEQLQNLTVEGNKKEVIKVKRVLHSLITVFHRKYWIIGKNLGKPSYEDIMASILSMYVDLLAAELSESEGSECQTEGKHLARLIMFIFKHKPDYGLDVVAQLGCLEIRNTSLLLPLFRCVLCGLNVEGPPVYTKYIYCVRRILDVFNKDDLKDVIQASATVEAPSDYLNWLRDQEVPVIDEMPETKHFKGIQVTKYLLNEAEPNLIEDLLNLVTEELSEEEQVIEKLKSKQPRSPSPLSVEEENTPVDDLFFIDKTADKRFQVEAADGEDDFEIDDAISDEDVAELELSDAHGLEHDSNEEMLEENVEIQKQMETTRKDILIHTAKALDDVIEIKQIDIESNQTHVSATDVLENLSEQEAVVSKAKIQDDEENEEDKTSSPIKKSLHFRSVKTFLKSPQKGDASKVTDSHSKRVEIVESDSDEVIEINDLEPYCDESNVKTLQTRSAKKCLKSPYKKDTSKILESDSEVIEIKEVEQNYDESTIKRAKGEKESNKMLVSPTKVQEKRSVQDEAVSKIKVHKDDEVNVIENPKTPSPIKKYLRSRTVLSPFVKKCLNSPQRRDSSGVTGSPRKRLDMSKNAGKDLQDSASHSESTPVRQTPGRKSQSQVDKKYSEIQERGSPKKRLSTETGLKDASDAVSKVRRIHPLSCVLAGCQRTLRTRTVSTSSNVSLSSESENLQRKPLVSLVKLDHSKVLRRRTICSMPEGREELTKRTGSSTRRNSMSLSSVDGEEKLPKKVPKVTTLKGKDNPDVRSSPRLRSRGNRIKAEVSPPQKKPRKT